ncbi:hypothetical protein CRG98_035469 [Punica granatum]|uniref:Uncharacterized protein n=1 Tax=Punica granatum TaxID=22663 RepID=A0A2I0IJF0_PUNGR|nr:hypothetical protein CRG98_035469 [Punica granatum]
MEPSTFSFASRMSSLSSKFFGDGVKMLLHFLPLELESFTRVGGDRGGVGIVLIEDVIVGLVEVFVFAEESGYVVILLLGGHLPGMMRRRRKR